MARVAYADPPYIGQANRYPEKTEVDHRVLIRELQEYDGWALSASSPSLKQIIPMFNEVTDDYRVGSWVKPFCAYKPNVNPAFAWEPVIFRPVRKYTREDLTVRDWVSAEITLERGVVGAKPIDFCYWLFRVLALRPDDEFVDLFPGSGAVTTAWQQFKTQREMF